MAGINQGRPEVAVGEPIRFGDIDGFELEQHPVNDRLIIRDTENGKVAYVRKERGGSIGGDGVLIKALKEGKPMADDGRTYDTIQQAEREATAWVFVPPGTYNETVEIDTDGLTLQGSGNNTIIDGRTVGSDVVDIRGENVTVRDLSVTNTPQGDGTEGAAALRGIGGGETFINITVPEADGQGISSYGPDALIVNCRLSNCESNALGGGSGPRSIAVNCILEGAGASGVQQPDEMVIANCIIKNTDSDGIRSANNGNSIFIGNRIINSNSEGIRLDDDNNICANNRVSGSTNSDIQNNGTGNVLDANLTGASN